MARRRGYRDRQALACQATDSLLCPAAPGLIMASTWCGRAVRLTIEIEDASNAAQRL